MGHGVLIAVDVHHCEMCHFATGTGRGRDGDDGRHLLTDGRFTDRDLARCSAAAGKGGHQLGRVDDGAAAKCDDLFGPTRPKGAQRRFG